MPRESIQEKIKRIRPPRVHITYDVEIDGAQQLKELPFVAGVMGDFSAQPEEPLPPLSGRRFVEVDRDTFDDVLAGMKPHVNLRVDNKLAGDDSKLSVDLRFSKLENFEPDQVVQQVEPLKKLVELRRNLSDLLAKAVNSNELEGLLQKVMENTEAQKQLGEELGIQAPGEKKEE